LLLTPLWATVLDVFSFGIVLWRFLLVRDYMLINMHTIKKFKSTKHHFKGKETKVNIACFEYKNRVLLTSILGALVKLTIKGNYYHKRMLLLTLLSINYTISMH